MVHHTENQLTIYKLETGFEYFQSEQDFKKSLEMFVNNPILQNKLGLDVVVERSCDIEDLDPIIMNKCRHAHTLSTYATIQIQAFI